MKLFGDERRKYKENLLGYIGKKDHLNLLMILQISIADQIAPVANSTPAISGTSPSVSTSITSK